MSFRTALITVAVVFTASQATFVMASDLVSKDDLIEHVNQHDMVSIPTARGTKREPIPVADAIVEQAGEMTALRLAFFDFLASDIARRAAARMPEASDWRARHARHDEVKARALQNLSQGLPAGAGDLLKYDYNHH